MTVPRFALDPIGWPSSADRYRAIKISTPAQRGWDVYALQTALIALGYKLPRFGADGFMGAETAAALIQHQKDRLIAPDGKAGQVTQTDLVMHGFAYPLQEKLLTPPGLARGQIESETSYWIGTYSAKHPDDDNFDLGIAQQNLEPTDANCLKAFNVKLAIDYYFEHLTTYFKRYEAVTDLKRRWELAAGAHNAPAWTDILAGVRQGHLSDAQLAHIEGYIDRATQYMVIS